MAKKTSKNPVYRDAQTGQYIEKKTDTVPRELRSIIIETRGTSKSSTEILKKLRYG